MVVYTVLRAKSDALLGCQIIVSKWRRIGTAVFPKSKQNKSIMSWKPVNMMRWNLVDIHFLSFWTTGHHFNANLLTFWRWGCPFNPRRHRPFCVLRRHRGVRPTPRVWPLIELEPRGKKSCRLSRDEANDAQFEGQRSNGDLWGPVNDPKVENIGS